MTRVSVDNRRGDADAGRDREEEIGQVGRATKDQIERVKENLFLVQVSLKDPAL